MKTGDKRPVRENNTEIKLSESLGLRQGGLVLLYFGDKCIGLLNPCHWSCDSHGTHTHTKKKNPKQNSLFWVLHPIQRLLVDLWTLWLYRLRIILLYKLYCYTNKMHVILMR